tara:strand:+ start:301 stop:498 length:198 start_codon:yes stop_codon:yes gene_type:complete
MIKKIWNWIKNLFKPHKQEIAKNTDVHSYVLKSEILVHEEKKLHCSGHTRFRKSCPLCLEIVGVK